MDRLENTYKWELFSLNGKKKKEKKRKKERKRKC